jgi:hypothetical protein
MPIADKDQLFARLEELGEQEVRVRLAQGTFARHKRGLIELWLSQKEKERQTLQEINMPLNSRMKDIVTLLKKDGKRFENIRASVQRDKIFTNDPIIPIEEGDVFERTLRNGIIERYTILDAGYYEAMGGHYQSVVRKQTKIDPSVQSTHIVYNLIGPNARVNIQSFDSSTNKVEIGPKELFERLHSTITENISDKELLQKLQNKVTELEKTQGTHNFLARYQEFMTLAANHMTVLAPFMPALAQLLK